MILFHLFVYTEQVVQDVFSISDQSPDNRSAFVSKLSALLVQYFYLETCRLERIFRSLATPIRCIFFYQTMRCGSLIVAQCLGLTNNSLKSSYKTLIRSYLYRSQYERTLPSKVLQLLKSFIAVYIWSILYACFHRFLVFEKYMSEMYRSHIYFTKFC